MLTVPLIGDQVNLSLDNDSSNSLEHVLFPAATLISPKADQLHRQYSHMHCNVPRSSVLHERHNVLRSRRAPCIF